MRTITHDEAAGDPLVRPFGVHDDEETPARVEVAIDFVRAALAKQVLVEIGDGVELYMHPAEESTFRIACSVISRFLQSGR